mmetsp:Transcript_20722/g.47025  ORF Transcript_20722/g.47025 Transcript_20722/m.47025 type:complete len:204 (+) Transcript_20722:438-1049(+)
MSDPSAASKPSAQLYAAQIYLCVNQLESALQLIFLGTTFEHLYTTVQIYIRMDRLDLAEETLGAMKNADEDCSLTQLSAVHIAIASGSSKSTDASYILSALSEQYGPSPMLLNLTAASLIVSGRYDEAEEKCKEVLTEDATNIDAMINSVTCFVNLGKYVEVESMIGRIKSVAGPEHSFVKNLERVEGAFDRVSSTYSAGIAA